MASVYKHPGVYVEEIATFPPSIAEVETAIPAFIGYTETDKVNGVSMNLKPVRITSLKDYETIFGWADKENDIEITVTDILDGTVLVKREFNTHFIVGASKFNMYYMLQMYFANGGGPCFIVSVGLYSAGVAPDKDDITTGIKAIEGEDEPTLLVCPDAVNLPSADYYKVVIDECLKQCKILQDRFTIIDIIPDDSGAAIKDPAKNFRDQISSNLDMDKYAAAYYPYLKTLLNFRYDESDVKIKYTGNALDGKSMKEISTADTALYNQLRTEINKLTVTLPPSAAVAGIYAAVDSSRGVWKAPANVSMSYVKELEVKISDLDQDGLNVDPTAGKSINAIRYFTGKGVMVWGARTLAGNDNEWRYVPVRRFFNFAEESIKKGTNWVVFEPNDANTWVRVKGMIENFLIKQWRAGALAGAKPEHAFFVRVGLGETMTALDILEGRLNVEIGMAVVRPAEFIILKFSHKLQES